MRYFTHQPNLIVSVQLYSNDEYSGRVAQAARMAARARGAHVDPWGMPWGGQAYSVQLAGVACTACHTQITVDRVMLVGVKCCALIYFNCPEVVHSSICIRRASRTKLSLHSIQ